MIQSINIAPAKSPQNKAKAFACTYPRYFTILVPAMLPG